MTKLISNATHIHTVFLKAKYLQEGKRAYFSLELFNFIYVVINCAKIFDNSQIKKKNN